MGLDKLVGKVELFGYFAGEGVHAEGLAPEGAEAASAVLGGAVEGVSHFQSAGVPGGSV